MLGPEYEENIYVHLFLWDCDVVTFCFFNIDLYGLLADGFMCLKINKQITHGQPIFDSPIAAK